MTRARAPRCLFLAALVPAALARAQTPAEPPDACARRLLERAAAAYREGQGFTETLHYRVEAPGSERVEKRLEAVASGRDFVVRDPSTTAVVVGAALYLTRPDHPARYLEVAFRGDLSAALEQAAGPGLSLFEPLSVAMRGGKGWDGWLEILRFKQLGPLTVRGCSSSVPAGAAIRLQADNGSLDLRLGARDGLPIGVELRFRPSGAPEGVEVHVEGSYERSAPPERIGFDASGKERALRFEDLGAAGLAPGSPAPPVLLSALSGADVPLSAYRGRVVVLDFWASWCAPCWKALEEGARLIAWARERRIDLVLLPVNTLEDLPSEERRRRVAGLWAAKAMPVPTLLDEDGAAFRAFGAPGLPSVAVIGPDGVLQAIHQGVPGAATLREEVAAAGAPR